ncbi:MAG: SDR family NAD(P)-dependent oxidoreductase [Bacteroidales bacterium]|nr:SDR family NAD(P)-dependent oxidoreductase [Bacteroidales bacterium]
MINYIFSGIGHAVGRYQITNEDIFEATQKGLLSGFDEQKVLSSKNYQQFSERHPGVSPFDYFAEYKMGFKYRNTVVPFPPKKKHFLRTENSTELAVRAINNAFNDANIDPKLIDAWFVSTVSPHEQAPGIAATIKTYFVDRNNLTPTFTLASGCSGFNLNLERALEYLKDHNSAKHVVVAHTETMSSFLTEKSKFVSFVTFGDGAGAVILSKVESEEKEGIVAIENFQDLHMIDFVGVDKSWNLYMGESVIKDRAIINLIKSTKSILEKTKWSVDEIDLLVPHQTGNAILIDVAKTLNLPKEKLYLEAQRQFGNVSGSTVLLSLSLLNQSGTLTEGKKILSATAGVGGKYGAFSYIVPKKAKLNLQIEGDLKGKNVLVVGASGGIGLSILEALKKREANIIFTYRNENKAEEINSKFPSAEGFELNLMDFNSIHHFIESLKKAYTSIDHLIFTPGISGGLISGSEIQPEMYKQVHQINYQSLVSIYQNLFDSINSSVVWLGSAAEDAQFAGSSAYVSSKKALHGFVASASWEAFSKGLRMIYYMPGVVATGMTNELNPKQAFIAMQQINQAKILDVDTVAENIVKSLYLIKIEGVDDTFENILTVRRHGYLVSDNRW